jgi:AraC-like DNA-binding protein
VITDGLLADPADARDLAHWAFDVGAGVRTVSRLFVAQTGMTFGQWRTHARVRAAVTLLADGLPVGTVARRVGFTKPAAFSAAFRRVTGRSPSAFGPARVAG